MTTGDELSYERGRPKRGLLLNSERSVRRKTAWFEHSCSNINRVSNQRGCVRRSCCSVEIALACPAIGRIGDEYSLMKKMDSGKSKRIGEDFLRKDGVNRRAHGKQHEMSIGKRFVEERFEVEVRELKPHVRNLKAFEKARCDGKRSGYCGRL